MSASLLARAQSRQQLFWEGHSADLAQSRIAAGPCMRPAAAACGSLGFADPGGGSTSSSSTRPRRKLGRVAVAAALGRES
ncbi:hypothetical protein AK812_SmicGene23945 [Symbiodinium microadriaticum]|uniref:Uncharacterized protein n=1 Tax=Symbiodinium microadriaticum TaxID=2951 RepID=A0A1Q9DFW2_SYMMI|nr:hypothetical protein AK812_SmicGene23945 [Symbiodinium microadriaticum]